MTPFSYSRRQKKIFFHKDKSFGLDTCNESNHLICEKKTDANSNKL